MENRIKKLEECNEKIAVTLVQIKADLKENSKRTKEIHKVVMGNGDPQKGVLDRVTKLETKFLIIMGGLGALALGVIDYVVRNILY